MSPEEIVSTEVVETEEEKAARSAAVANEAAGATVALANGAAAAAALDAGERMRRFEEESTTWRTGHSQKVEALETEVKETRAAIGSLVSLISERLTPPPVVVVPPETLQEGTDPKNAPGEAVQKAPETPKRKHRFI